MNNPFSRAAAKVTGLASAALVASSFVMSAQASPILVFSQQGIGTPVSATVSASGTQTTIGGVNIAITISGIAATRTRCRRPT